MRTRSLLCVKPVEKAKAGTVSSIDSTSRMDMNLIFRIEISFLFVGFSFNIGFLGAGQPDLRFQRLCRCHIMRDQSGVIAVHCAWRVKQHCQQILPDVANPRCILLQAVRDETNMFAVQLQQL